DGPPRPSDLDGPAFPVLSGPDEDDGEFTEEDGADELVEGLVSPANAARTPTDRFDLTAPTPMVRPQEARARDAALIAPLPSLAMDYDEDEDEDDEPDAVLPQAPQARPTRQSHRTARSNAIQPGHLICGDCGQGNTPTRRFCSRCGSELNEAAVARTPWWRRLQPRRGPRVVALGTGAGRNEPTVAPGERFRQIYGKVKIVMGCVVFLACFMYASYTPFRNEVNGRVDGVRASALGFIQSHYSPVRPSKVSTKGSTNGHGPENMVDLNAANFWARPFDPDPMHTKDEVVVTVEFDRIVSLNQLIITSGASDAFTDHGRPRELVLKFTNGKVKVITLQDTAKPQKFPLKDATAIKSVQITVTNVFPSEKNKDVAISELEFFSLLS
ncbi:hypothetical protein AB0D66_29295, partial [Streptomyces sp. NPDC048270]|uniref:NADase-type glycan-binding domain-containing protein n=1 Tax=Streptomyces sp. NPDC048270 TaxID=3154615 RepID=UPI0033CAB186